MPAELRNTGFITFERGAMVNFIVSNLRLALPIAVFFFFYQPFEFLDDKVSESVKLELADFLKGRKYETYLGVLPSLIERAFNRVFGSRHMSWRCMRASFAISIIAILFAFISP
jgi:hypothetical protein